MKRRLAQTITGDEITKAVSGAMAVPFLDNQLELQPRCDALAKFGVSLG
jgi:hypothetical protein